MRDNNDANNDKHGHKHGHSVQVDIKGDNGEVITRDNMIRNKRVKKDI